MTAPVPLARPFPLARVSPQGVDAEVVANPDERARLAAELDLPAIHSLVGRFRLAGTTTRIRVTGRVVAEVEQVCVVTLEPFRTTLDEPVDVAFAPGLARDDGAAGQEVEADLDAPEELVGDRLDLGALTAEFLALGLDPYPRRPGVDFQPAGPDPGDSPFAKLAVLRDPGPDESA